MSLSFCGTTTVLPSIQVGTPTPWYGTLAATVPLASSYTVNVSRIHAARCRASGDSQPYDGCTGTAQFTLDARRPADGSRDARHGCRSAPTATAPRSELPAVGPDRVPVVDEVHQQLGTGRGDQPQLAHPLVAALHEPAVGQLVRRVDGSRAGQADRGPAQRA